MNTLRFLFLLIFFINIESETMPINTGHAEVSLIKSSIQHKDKEILLLGIKMDMQEGWHTYWKNPGDSGGPIEVNWNQSKNLEIGPMKWPVPELIPYEPLMTYGYNNLVIYPFEYTQQNKNLSIIEANIDFLICADICVPEKAYIKTNLDDVIYDDSLNLWNSKVPSVTLPVLANVSEDRLELRFSSNAEIDFINFFIDKQNIVLHAQKQSLVKEENNWLLQIPLEDSEEKLEVINGVILINNDAFLINADVNYSSENKSGISFLSALLFAFIGGLILNLMPCVFPIISLKILSFVSMGNESTMTVRKHALSFCSGVILSFLIIGVALIIFKEAGTSLGWGFQLQSPAIVSILSLIMFIIGIILLTDIDIGSSFSRLGSYGSNSIGGSFLTGVLAVVVASPCTAPFMGAALGYALIQPSNETLPIFISLGSGFAAPYFALSAFPNLIKFMPKPGNWMVTLKEFFAFPMFATALWLIWVYSFQVNNSSLITLLGVFLAIGILFWLLLKIKKPILKIFIWLSVITLVIAQSAINSSNGDLSISINNNEISEDFTVWNSNIESEYKDRGQAYLINFTAAWCITCQANDKIALSRPNIKDYLKNNNIEYIVADWTNKNDEILSALEKYERNGVPLYIYWKPGMESSEILPAILTQQILLDSF